MTTENSTLGYRLSSLSYSTFLTLNSSLFSKLCFSCITSSRVSGGDKACGRESDGPRSHRSPLLFLLPSVLETLVMTLAYCQLSVCRSWLSVLAISQWEGQAKHRSHCGLHRLYSNADIQLESSLVVTKVQR